MEQKSLRTCPAEKPKTNVVEIQALPGRKRAVRSFKEAFGDIVSQVKAAARL